MTGQKFGRLTFVRFMQNTSGGAQWVLACDCGNETLALRKNVIKGRTASCGCFGSEKAKQLAAQRRAKNERPSYDAVHCRLKVDRDSASHYPCVDCGGSADDWSLNKDAAEVLEGPHPRTGRWKRWSVNLDDYEPRCTTCHMRYDLGRKAS